MELVDVWAILSLADGLGWDYFFAISEFSMGINICILMFTGSFYTAKASVNFCVICFLSGIFHHFFGVASYLW